MSALTNSPRMRTHIDKEISMNNRAQLATDLPTLYRERHGAFGEVILDHELRKSAEWRSQFEKLSAERAELQAALDAKSLADETRVIAPLRRAAAAALDAHMVASERLESARIRSESETRVLRNKIDALTARIRTPMFPTPTAWTAAEQSAADLQEVGLAASTPMNTAGGWIDPTKIVPGMPSSFS